MSQKDLRQRARLIHARSTLAPTLQILPQESGVESARERKEELSLGARIPLKAIGAAPPNGGGDFISGMNPAILALETVIADIARTNFPVLIVGESGTGKQMFARRIHSLSAQSRQPLTRIACGSMAAESFSAALELNENATGRGAEMREAAGTVFFDEVGELEATCQRILLHALPDGEGSMRPGTLAARIIAATSQNLDQETRAGRFRAELFYRINGVCLRLPPLRERREDIPLLAERFLTKHAALLGRSRRPLSSQMLQTLSEYGWPGNIRQLENVVRNIVALGDEEFAVSELTLKTPENRPAAANVPSDSLRAASRAASREAERDLILKALDRTRWNRKRAAQDLQISYKSLLYKLKLIRAEEPEVRTA
jgi:two-component system response regulator AtoC